VGEGHTVTCRSFVSLTVKTALNPLIFDKITEKREQYITGTGKDDNTQ